MRRGTILDRLGPTHGRKLAETFGGTRISVPESLADGSQLATRVGLDLALLLIAEYAGERIYIPLADAAPRTLDGEAIRTLSRDGHSAATIARRLGCSIRAVHANRKEPTT